MSDMVMSDDTNRIQSLGYSPSDPIKVPDSFKNDPNLQSVVQLTQAPKNIKTTYTPSNWKTVIEHLRALLINRKMVYIQFDYMLMPKDDLKKCSGFVTIENIKYLPRLLIRAWSDITLYDIADEYQNGE